MNQREFEKAVLNEGYRAEFIKNINLEDTAKYIKSTHYSPKNLHVMETCTPFLTYTFGIKSLKSKVIIYSASFDDFEYHKTIGDFLSSLIDHEGFHAKETFLYPAESGVTPISIFEYLITNKSSNKLKIFEHRIKREIRAYDNQIKNFSQRDVSNEYVNFILEYEKNYRDLFHTIKVYQDLGKEDILLKELKNNKLLK